MTRVLIELPPSVDAAAIARAAVAEHGAQLPAAVLDDAILLVSEIVTNAIRHGAPAISLRIRTDPPGIGIEVADEGDELPTLPDARPDPLQENGRGMLIVAALAKTWGVTRSETGRGKTVWFELDGSEPT